MKIGTVLNSVLRAGERMPANFSNYKKHTMKSGIELIAEERKEQTEKHGYDVSNPANAEWYSKKELVKAALHYLTLYKRYNPKSWGAEFHRKLAHKALRLSPTEFDIERLKIAGALIAAELDRLNNYQPSTEIQPDGVKEAADKYAKDKYPTLEDTQDDFSFNMQEGCQQECSEHFLAGASWQAEQGEKQIYGALMSGLQHGYALDNSIPFVDHMAKGVYTKLCEIWQLSRSSSVPSAIETVGSILKKQLATHELDWQKVADKMQIPVDVMEKVLADEYYTNSIPVVLFKDLLLSLYISFAAIKPAMYETIKLLVSKEPPFEKQDNKKRTAQALWENEEALTKYVTLLQKIMS